MGNSAFACCRYECTVAGELVSNSSRQISTATRIPSNRSSLNTGKSCDCIGIAGNDGAVPRLRRVASIEKTTVMHLSVIFCNAKEGCTPEDATAHRR